MPFVEAHSEKVKQAAADLVEMLLAEHSSPRNELGEALRTLIVPNADRELRLQKLAQLIRKTNVSVDEFCMAIGMPVMQRDGLRSASGAGEVETLRKRRLPKQR